MNYADREFEELEFQFGHCPSQHDVRCFLDNPGLHALDGTPETAFHAVQQLLPVRQLERADLARVCGNGVVMLAASRRSSARSGLAEPTTTAAATRPRSSSCWAAGYRTAHCAVSRRCQLLGLPDTIWKDYLDQVAALVPGAARRPSQRPEWESLLYRESRAVPLELLWPVREQWFDAIDRAVDRIRTAMDERRALER
jgi:hypothetical protein